MALSTLSNFSVILLILFVKLAKTPAIAVATLAVLFVIEFLDGLVCSDVHSL